MSKLDEYRTALQEHKDVELFFTLGTQSREGSPPRMAKVMYYDLYRIEIKAFNLDGVLLSNNRPLMEAFVVAIQEMMPKIMDQVQILEAERMRKFAQAAQDEVVNTLKTIHVE